MSARRISAGDLGEVAELERLCFDEPWSENALRLLTGTLATGAVCLCGGRVIAYGGMLWAPDEGQITDIAVHPDFRRRGYGAEILAFLLDAAQKNGCRQVSLEVRASNAAARALYRRFGFTDAGVRRHFYKNPVEDAVVMLCDLTSGRE